MKKESSNHTPAPWQYEMDGEAKARLIDAAPDMIEILEEMFNDLFPETLISIIDELPEPHKTYNKHRVYKISEFRRKVLKVIKKARGGEGVES